MIYNKTCMKQLTSVQQPTQKDKIKIRIKTSFLQICNSPTQNSPISNHSQDAIFLIIIADEISARPFFAILAVMLIIAGCSRRYLANITFPKQQLIDGIRNFSKIRLGGHITESIMASTFAISQMRKKQLQLHLYAKISSSKDTFSPIQSFRKQHDMHTLKNILSKHVFHRRIIMKIYNSQMKKMMNMT